MHFMKYLAFLLLLAFQNSFQQLVDSGESEGQDLGLVNGYETEGGPSYNEQTPYERAQERVPSFYAFR
uniref:Uncharacterized protein n=1 Tax=Strongyloides papillosus TaxID=174720 RepID=A0A0N5CGH9_STREA